MRTGKGRVRQVAALLMLTWMGSWVQAAGPVLTYDGVRYEGDNLPAAVGRALYDLEQQVNNQRKQVMDNYAANRYLEEESARLKKDPRQLQQELLGVPAPDETQIKAFFDANRQRIPGTLEQMRGEIVKYLENQAMIARQRELMARIASEKGYQVELPMPAPLRMDVVTQGYPSKGAEDAPVTLVEFADYQCPHCRDAQAVLERLEKQYKGRLRVVYRDFPINASGISRKVAEAAVCADEQGQFWAFNQLAFERQRYLSTVTPQMLADELELDADKFSACLEQDGPKAKVAASASEARELGLTSTPSFFVNGLALPHTHDDLELALRQLIDAELQAQN